MTERLRVAVIGPGLIARRHLEALRAEPDVDLVGIVGRRLDRAEAVAAEFGGRPFDRVERLLERETVDAAWICIPPDQHGAIERILLERGVHLFVEKPLAADSETPVRIAAAIDAAGVVAAAGYHWRAMDTLPEVERLLATNRPRLVIGHWHDSLPGIGWWRQEDRSGGQMVEQATHLVDLSRRLVGEATVIAATADRHPHAVFPEVDVAYASTALLRYESGASGAFTATCVLGSASAIELQVLGEGLAITIRQDGVTYAGGQPDASPAAGAPRFVPTANDPIRDEDRAFLASIRTGDRARPFSTYEDAVRTHRLTVAIREAGALASGD